MKKINGWIINDVFLINGKKKCFCTCEKCGKTYERVYKCLSDSKCCKSCSHLKHGHSRDRLYFVWAQMKDRCLNPKSKSYHHYGARGITVFDDWIKSFESFYNWAVTHGYKNGLTIDRINNEYGYYPDNCRWCTMEVQNMNKRHLRKSNTGIVGVYKHKDGRKRPFEAYVKQIKLGMFETEEQAAKARENYLKGIFV